MVGVLSGMLPGAYSATINWAPPARAPTFRFGPTFLLRDAMSRRHGREAIAQPSWGGFEVQDVMYLVGPITWLGGLAPFLALAGVGAPLFLIWQLWDFRRAAAARAEDAAP